VQVAYAIGVAHPVSVFVETFGTHKIDEPLIADLLRVHFDLRPAAIIHNLNLRRPIYQQTAASATRPPGSRSAVGEDGQGRGAAQRRRPERRRRPGTRTAHRVAVTRPKRHRNVHRTCGARTPLQLQRYNIDDARYVVKIGWIARVQCKPFG
jgi:hypothetical protein